MLHFKASKTAAFAAALAALASPVFAGWSVEKNEPDPFAPNHTSTFISSEGGVGHKLVIRCLEGELSLLLSRAVGSF